MSAPGRFGVAALALGAAFFTGWQAHGCAGDPERGAALSGPGALPATGWGEASARGPSVRAEETRLAAAAQVSPAGACACAGGDGAGDGYGYGDGDGGRVDTAGQPAGVLQAAWQPGPWPEALPEPDGGVSSRGGAPAQLLLINNCRGLEAEVLGVNFRGEERRSQSLAPSESRWLQTAAGYRWRIRARAGRALLAEVVAKEGSQLVRLCGANGAAELLELPPEEAAPDARAALVAEVRDAGFPACTPRTVPATQRCTPAGESPAVQLAFLNTCVGEEVEVLWVNRECQEVPYGRIPAGDVFYVSTFVGHPWRLRVARSSALVGELMPTLPVSTVSPTCVCGP